ncbi:DUF4185 domain-containing protein [Mucilaginibacter litoreus]|uniref:DUF4185 domain-containing protein n=1 Tax=Mucilaginibacter litoreus TaxID=1048221 RepID=A0ABW3AQ13_9SPHI
MSVKQLFIFLIGTAFSHASMAQQAKELPLDASSIQFTVSVDTGWTSLLKRTSGWFGADGIYTIPLNGSEAKQSAANDRSLLIFSDSMVGEIKDSVMQPGYKMIHNSVALLKGSKPVKSNIQFFWDKNKDGSAESVFIPQTSNTQKGDYYWLGDGFVNTDGDGSLYIFGYRVRNVSNEAFGFREVGNTLLKLKPKEAPAFKSIKQKDTPLYLTDDKKDIGSFGAGIYVNTKSAGAVNADGYIYVYGVRGMAKNLMVARVLPKQFENYNHWEFWDGKKWVADMGSVADISNHVSNELSVSRLADGRYAMVFQIDGMSTGIGMRLANKLTGPWGPIIKLWDCKPDLIKNTFVVYNAKAHPSLSGANELLISYNINSVDFINDLKQYPQLYRPRFIKVIFN